MTSPTSGERRTFMAAAGIVALGSFLVPAGGAVAASDGETANLATVDRFCAAWATREIARILEFLTDDCVYRMTETTPPATGHQEISARIKTFVDSADSIEFRILDSYAKGPMVVNHRVDRFASATRPLTWEGVGVFFLQNGKIREWFDYTIRITR